MCGLSSDGQWHTASCLEGVRSLLLGNIEFNKALAIISLTGIINRTILHKSSYQLLSCLFFSEGCLRVEAIYWSDPHPFSAVCGSFV